MTALMKEVRQAVSFTREEALWKAGEDLPSELSSGVSTPGVQIGGLQPVPPAKKLRSAGRKRGRVYGCFRRDAYH